MLAARIDIQSVRAVLLRPVVRHHWSKSPEQGR